MPAIQPARLRQQAALLVDHFNEPAAFVRSLHHLLEFYAERAYRPGQAGVPAPLLASYNVRPPVLRQVIVELAPLAREEPEAALDLCDALWQEGYFEFCQLAIALLGQIPCMPAEPILKRVRDWLKASLEHRLIDNIFQQGMSCLYQKNATGVIELAEQLIEDRDTFQQQMGLKALIKLVHKPDFDNYPVCYRLIQPLLRSTPHALRPELLDLIAALAHNSPSEMAYIFRQNLELPNSQDTAWLVRHSLKEFPPEISESLRAKEREMTNIHYKARKTETGLSR